MEELQSYVNFKATEYWNETTESGEQINNMPSSIVDFVIETASAWCHFPSHFTEEDIVNTLSKYKSVLAMMCVDVYAKSGVEGETSHSENGINRVYESAWISKSLLSRLPNFVTFMPI